MTIKRCHQQSMLRETYWMPPQQFLRLTLVISPCSKYLFAFVCSSSAEENGKRRGWSSTKWFRGRSIRVRPLSFLSCDESCQPTHNSAFKMRNQRIQRVITYISGEKLCRPNCGLRICQIRTSARAANSLRALNWGRPRKLKDFGWCCWLSLDDAPFNKVNSTNLWINQMEAKMRTVWIPQGLHGV